LVGGIPTPLKNMSQWEGLSHIYPYIMKNESHVPNHQPENCLEGIDSFSETVIGPFPEAGKISAQSPYALWHLHSPNRTSGSSLGQAWPAEIIRYLKILGETM
jgi:hypothetical protein